VINKADRPGADETRRDLERMLDLTANEGWRPPVIATTAATGEGAPALWAAIGDHREHLTSTGALAPRRAARVQDELVRIVAALLHERALATGGPALEDLSAEVAARRVDPWSAAEQLLDR
jgi:LAO/AO transport system kinase